MAFPPTPPSPRRPPLRIAIVASECAPFAKTGGLADVASALGAALWRRGHDVRVFLPNYRSLGEAGHQGTPGLDTWTMEFPGRSIDVRTLKIALPASENDEGEPLQVELVDAPTLFDRDGFYGEEADEPLRWAAFNRAVLESFQRTGWSPDVIHANDWHTGLLPLILRAGYKWDQLFADTRTLLSIHNLGYQGAFPASSVEMLGLDRMRDQLHQERLQQGSINFLETGLLHAHWLSTVSKTYAREIQTEDQGFALDGILRQRDDHLVGIVNGVDYADWSPDVDPHIAAPFGPDDLAGKRVCRDALLDEFNLAPDPKGPVYGIVSRMTGQKGFELLPEVLTPLLQQNDVRLCVLGSGEKKLERYFQWLRDTFPDKVGVYFGYKNPLSHRIEAGSDVFLMPSRYEPCGLNQLYSLRYGTLPLVRATGGLADTVERYDPEAGTGTGFVFYEYESSALDGALRHSLDVWRDQDAWAGIQRRGMLVDASWERQVREYEDLYATVMTDVHA
ncbi:MAG: glycogen synthase [Planctomycetota bacterium]